MNNSHSPSSTSDPNLATPPRQAFNATQTMANNSSSVEDLSPTDIRRILSNCHARPPEASSASSSDESPSHVFTAPDGHQNLSYLHTY